MIPRSTLNFRATLRAAIEDYAEAFEANANKGGGDPLAIPEIERNLQEARIRVNELVNRARGR